MDESSETLLKMLCCTCLSKDRKLIQLTKIKDGVNNLYSLLSLDSEAYQECFYCDVTSLFICWECSGIIEKLRKFRRRACIAQKLLGNLLDGKIELDKQESLSKLSIDNLTVNERIVTVSQTEEYNDDWGSSSDYVPLKDLKSLIGNSSKVVKEIEEENTDNDKYVLNQDSENEAYDNCDNIECKCDSLDKCRCFKELINNVDPQENNKEVVAEQSKTAISNAKRYKNKKKERDKKQTKFKCRSCGKHFESKSLRDRHSKRAHNEGFACSVCGKRYPFKYNLLQHERRHQGPLPREECPVCRKMIRTDLVKVHARIHTDRQSYACLKCDKTYVSKASYENHLKFSQAHAVTDVLKCKCYVCGKGYRTEAELRDHVNYQHLGESKHKCPICDKPLATRRCITRHVRRTHHNIKENLKDKMCQKCGKAFRYKKSLQEHELIHTGEKPLSCSECGRRFRQSAALYTHCRRVHHTGQTDKLTQS